MIAFLERENTAMTMKVVIKINHVNASISSHVYCISLIIMEVLLALP